MDPERLISNLLPHLTDVVAGKDVHLVDRRHVERGLRSLVMDASKRPHYAKIVRKALAREKLLPTAMSIWIDDDTRWHVALQSALRDSSDRELVIFGIQPYAIFVLVSYFLIDERLDDETHRLWMSAAETSDADNAWCQQTAQRLIATIGS